MGKCRCYGKFLAGGGGTLFLVDGCRWFVTHCCVVPWTLCVGSAYGHQVPRRAAPPAQISAMASRFETLLNHPSYVEFHQANNVSRGTLDTMWSSATLKKVPRRDVEESPPSGLPFLCGVPGAMPKGGATRQGDCGFPVPGRRCGTTHRKGGCGTLRRGPWPRNLAWASPVRPFLPPVPAPRLAPRGTHGIVALP